MNDLIEKGRCYCGKTGVTVSGPPAIEGFCHCTSCQKYHGAPFQAFSAWMSENVTLDGQTITSKECDQTHRVSCAHCGGAVLTKKPENGMTVVFPSTLKDSGRQFSGGLHIFYGERTMDVADGLPKFEDVPQDFGGSGTTLPEPKTSQWLATNAG